MDPAANLKEQRELAAKIIEDVDREGEWSREGLEETASDAERLAELVQALDEWRRNGGFDPYTTV
jgi:hypothetical protein